MVTTTRTISRIIVKKKSLAIVIPSRNELLFIYLSIIYFSNFRFDIPDPFLNPRVPCNALPEINLELWKERVACNVGGKTIQTGDAKRVSPCTMCTCTKEGPLCQSLKVENCFHLAQSFTRNAILNDHVCKVQCAFAFRAFPNVRTGENKIGFS